MMDWFPAVMTLVGVLVGVGIQEFRIWREKKEKYMDMVFEKRLDAHQGAYYWCMTLIRLMMPHRLMKEGGLGAVVKKVEEAIEWLNKNALYLDEGSRDKMDSFFQYITETCRKYIDEKGRKGISVKEEAQKLVKNAGEVLGSIERGIGFKYLPEQEISIENIEEEKLFDEAVEEMEELIRKQKK